MISVVLLAPSLGGGGAEQQLLRVANALNPREFDVSVAVVRRGGAYEDRLNSEIPLIPLTPFDVASSSTIGSIAALRPLRKLLDRQRPDVLVPFHTTMILLAWLAGRFFENVSIVGSVQNNLSHEADESDAVTWCITHAAARVLNRLDAVIALSHGVADDLRSNWQVGSRRMSVVHNAGFDHLTRSMSEAPLPVGVAKTHRYTIAACGRLSRQKGYPVLLRAFARVVSQHDCALWIVGDGPDRRALEDLSRELGIRKHVTFFGYRTNPYPFMRQADVFVLSSLYEGFGNVITEAMWLGTPVVAADCESGPAEIIGRDSSSGILFPVGDHEALSYWLRRLLKDDSLRETLSRGGLRRAELFSDRSSAVGYESVIKGLLCPASDR